MADDSGAGSSTSDLPAAQSSSLLSSQPLTEATEPTSSADQVPAPQLSVSTEVSAARGSLDHAAQPPPSLSSSQVARIALNREIARARLLSWGP